MRNMYLFSDITALGLRMGKSAEYFFIALYNYCNFYVYVFNVLTISQVDLFFLLLT